MSSSPPSAAPGRHLGLIGQDIWVFDDLLPNVGQMVQALDAAPFTRTEVATPETAQFRHWVNEMDLRTLASLPVFKATQAALKAVMPDRSYRAYRCYTNFAAYGDVLPIHTDCRPDADEYTALWFLAGSWQPAWGGETVFYDARHDAHHAVSPRPGRLVLFHGAIPHAGRPPERLCLAPRYTFAIKLERCP